MDIRIVQNDRLVLYDLADRFRDIKTLKPIIEALLPEAEARYRRSYMRSEVLRRYIVTHGDKACMASRGHLRTLFEGRFDESYIESIKGVVSVGQEIGFNFRSHVFFVTNVLACLGESLTGWRSVIDRRGTLARYRLAERCLMFDVATLSGYETQHIAAIEGARRETVQVAIDGFKSLATAILQDVESAAASCLARSSELDALNQTIESARQAVVASADDSLESVAQTHLVIRDLVREIRSIGAKAASGEKLAAEAADIAARSRASIEALCLATHRIDAMVDDIARIATQTNLLALNATIEAARAGDAGRGFTIVASEVKTLAAQTSRATRDITRWIGETESRARQVSSDIVETSEKIAALTASSRAITHATAAQEAAALTITGAVEDSMSHTKHSVRRITILEENTEAIDDLVRGTSLQASTLSQVAETLSRRIGAFLDGVRAA